MTIQNFKKTVLFSIFTLMVFTACNSNDGDDVKEREPLLIENHYFRGTLNGQEWSIERNLYDTYPLINRNYITIDFGGSKTDDSGFLGEQDTGFCYGRYACGLVLSDSTDNPDQLDSAKMYFKTIPIGDCTLENELISMKIFLERNNYEYGTFPEKLLLNTVALDFFPGNIENERIYYSSRFGDNTDASFKITSVSELENGLFEVEGNFNCKLYSNNDETDFKELKNGTFKIKIKSNLKK